MAPYPPFEILAIILARLVLFLLMCNCENGISVTSVMLSLLLLRTTNIQLILSFSLRPVQHFSKSENRFYSNVYDAHIMIDIYPSSLLTHIPCQLRTLPHITIIATPLQQWGSFEETKVIFRVIEKKGARVVTERGSFSNYLDIWSFITKRDKSYNKTGQL